MSKPLPIILQHGTLCFESLVEADIPGLVSLVEANREALQYMDRSTRSDWYRQSLAEQREGRALSLAVRLGVQLVGTTRFAEFLPASPACEIGWTRFDQAQHGSGLNRMIRYLMLKHTSDNLCMVCAQLSTVVSNLCAQGAIDKLGAQCEGVLRSHRRLVGGRLDDTFVYSITDHEWPRVKAALEAGFTG